MQESNGRETLRGCFGKIKGQAKGQGFLSRLNRGRMRQGFRKLCDCLLRARARLVGPQELFTHPGHPAKRLGNLLHDRVSQGAHPHVLRDTGGLQRLPNERIHRRFRQGTPRPFRARPRSLPNLPIKNARSTAFPAQLGGKKPLSINVFNSSKTDCKENHVTEHGFPRRTRSGNSPGN